MACQAVPPHVRSKPSAGGPSDRTRLHVQQTPASCPATYGITCEGKPTECKLVWYSICRVMLASAQPQNDDQLMSGAA